MGDFGYFGGRILFFLFALTILANITMVAVTRATRDIPASSSRSDESSPMQKRTDDRPESEDDLSSLISSKRDPSSPIIAKRADSVSDNENENASVTAVDDLESSPQKQETNVLEELYRVWDSKVGCRKFRAKIQDHEHRNSSFRSLQPEHLATCAELKQQHATVLVKSWTWIPDSMNGFYSCSCGLSCLWTKSEVLADDADVHFYEGAHPPLERKQGEPLRAYIDMEADGPRSNQEDFFVGYHAGANVQATYSSKADNGGKNHYISPTKRLDVLVYWSSSRCVAGRQAIASSFLPLISHHSFGKCLNNVGRNPGSDQDPLFDMYPVCKAGGADKHWYDHIHCAMSHYMFALAIENTVTESYVTEKLFYALEAGTVPIYFGAPNVLDLVPPNSIIQASKFTTTKELVAYVKEVAQDPVKYSEFHAWRRCGELGNYRHTWSMSLDNLPCRLATAASKLGGKNTPETTKHYNWADSWLVEGDTEDANTIVSRIVQKTGKGRIGVGTMVRVETPLIPGLMLTCRHCVELSENGAINEKLFAFGGPVTVLYVSNKYDLALCEGPPGGDGFRLATKGDEVKGREISMLSFPWHVDLVYGLCEDVAPTQVHGNVCMFSPEGCEMPMEVDALGTYMGGFPASSGGAVTLNSKVLCGIHVGVIWHDKDELSMPLVLGSKGHVEPHKNAFQMQLCTRQKKLYDAENGSTNTYSSSVPKTPRDYCSSSHGYLATYVSSCHIEEVFQDYLGNIRMLASRSEQY